MRIVREDFLEEVAVIGSWGMNKTIRTAELISVARKYGESLRERRHEGDRWVGGNEGLVTTLPFPQAHSMAVWSGPGLP